MSAYRAYIGVDWSTNEHQFVALSSTGEVLGEGRASGHQDLIASVVEVCGCDVEEVAVAIESRDLSVADALSAFGFALHSINPKAVDRFRDRFSSGGAKDDRRDALVLASALRTDPQAFNSSKQAPEQIALRKVVRFGERLKQQQRKVANQLGSDLFRWWPALYSLCPGADKNWYLDLVEKLVRLQTPSSVQRRVVAECVKRCRRLSVDDVLKTLRAPMAPVPKEVSDSIVFVVPMQLEQLRSLTRQLKQVGSQIELMVSRMKAPEGREHSDAELVASMPGAGPMVTSSLLAEAGGILEERNLPRLRTVGGIAPVSRSSGRVRLVRRRLACNPRLRDALYYACRTAVTVDGRFKDRYQNLRARGHGHARALRSVADTYLTVLIGVLKSGEPYRSPEA